MKLVNVMILALSLALVSCGTEEAKKDEASNDVQTEADIETVIAKVPVDAEGNELTGQMEMRTTQGEKDYTSETDLETAFAGGEKAAATDELDEDTSADSWHRRGYKRHGYWNTPWYAGKWLGRGSWWGRNPHLRSTRYSRGGHRSNGRYGGYTPYYYRARYHYPRYRYYTWCNRRAYRHGRGRTHGGNGGFGGGYNGTSYYSGY
jgi:hypothetical protein